MAMPWRSSYDDNRRKHKQYSKALDRKPRGSTEDGGGCAKVMQRRSGNDGRWEEKGK